jgi:phospho-N-acetylmuramoyl-pentapeptide-transferase
MILHPVALGSFWIAFGVAALLAYPIYRLLLRTKSRQIIDPYAPEKHMAKQGTPTMGGLIIVLGFCAATGFALTRALPEVQGDLLLAAITLFGGFALIGFLDDFIVPRLIAGKRGLGWKQKILLEILFAVVAAGMLFDFVATWELGLTVFVILFFANAFNFVDGLDGLAGSVLLGLAAGLAGISHLISSDPRTLILVAALSGAVIPFLFLNAPPAKVFMGDVGSLPIGAVLGLLTAFLFLSAGGEGWTYYTPYSSLYLAGASPANVAAALIVLSFLMVAELVPVPMQVAYYKLTKKRLFPMTPIHHAFEKKGWPETRVVWAFALFQLLLSALAVSIILWGYER